MPTTRPAMPKPPLSAPAVQAPMPAVISVAQAAPENPARPDGVVRSTRTLALLAWAALIVLGLAWELVIARTGRGTLALKVLPLLPAALGLWRLRLYTYRWLSLLVWLYFAEGVVRAWSDRGIGAALALAEALLALVLFGACLFHIRWRLSAARRSETVS
jgi:uncharacterized membrane protein